MYGNIVVHIGRIYRLYKHLHCTARNVNLTMFPLNQLLAKITLIVAGEYTNRLLVHCDWQECVRCEEGRRRRTRGTSRSPDEADDVLWSIA